MIDAEPLGEAHRSDCKADGATSANISKTKKSNKIPQDALNCGAKTTNDTVKREVNMTHGTVQTGRRNPASGRRQKQFISAMQFNAMMARLGLDLKDRLQECAPSSDDGDRIKRGFEELQAICSELGPRWRLEIFGSIANRFLTSTSDMDVTCVRGPAENKDGEEEDEPVDAKAILLDRLGKQLRQMDSFTITEEIPSAKVPILRLRFEENLDIDLSCQNTLALQNTQLLRAYAQIDQRILQLGIAVKMWTKAAKICGASAQKLSSYTFTLLMIYFMQVHQEVQLPRLDPALFEEGSDPAEREAAIAAATSIWSPLCTLSLPHLLFRFIHFYRWHFEWGREVASIRLGDRRYSHDKTFNKLRGRYVERIHVEDPYVLERNLHCVLGDPEEVQLQEAFNAAWQALYLGGTPVGLAPATTKLSHLQGEPIPLQLCQALPGDGPHFSPHFSPQPSPSLGPRKTPFLSPEAVELKPGRVDKANIDEPHPEPQPGFSFEGSTESSDGCPPLDPCATSSGEDDESAVAKSPLVEPWSEGQWWLNLTSKGVKQALWAKGASQGAQQPRILSMEQLESQMVQKQDTAALASVAGTPEKPPSDVSQPGQWWLNLGSAKVIEAVGATAPQEEKKKDPIPAMKLLTVQDLEGKMTHEDSAAGNNTGISSLVGRSFATKSTGKIASRLASKCFGHVPVPVQ